jgi:predicted  nucleic acid-binding Zn-ribbon protein
MSPTKEIYELQQREEEFALAREAMNSIRKNLGDTRVVDQVRLDHERARLVCETLLNTQKDLELQVSGLADQIHTVSKNLYDGSTTNSKELQNLQNELRMLNRQNSQLEDQLLEIMGKSESVQKDLHFVDNKLKSTESTWTSEQERLEQELQKLGQDEIHIKNECEKATARLTAEELTLYQALKATKGQAVSKVETGICRTCGLSLTSHEMQRARAGQELVRCGSCKRLLYVY